MSKKRRKQVRKGLRFEIFKRDGFTCQYCGRQPPEIVLQIDHITPVAEGGDNDPMNLVTACRDCNLGKGKKLLDRPKRPDADLAWLEIQQELAELQAYQEAKTQKDHLLTQVVEALQRTWFDCSGLDWCPAKHVVRQMLNKHDPETIEIAFADVSVKVAGGYLGKDNWLRYIWGMLKRRGQDANT